VEQAGPAALPGSAAITPSARRGVLRGHAASDEDVVVLRRAGRVNDG
jgi:hypothetical protein